MGNVIRTVDPLGQPTTLAYDALNRTVAVTDTLGHVTGFAYDAVGNLRYTWDPTGVMVENVYDGLDRLQEVRGPRQVVFADPAKAAPTSYPEHRGGPGILDIEPFLGLGRA